MQAAIERILNLSSDIRYVAIYREGKLASASRSNLITPSTAESDKYEELLVNPTLLTLLRQRGNIDCGGLEYVLIRYGSFFEFVAPLDDGHVSVGLESSADLVALAGRIAGVISGFSSTRRPVSRRAGT